MPGPLDNDIFAKGDFEFVRELERQSITEIQKLRTNERLEAKIAITLLPGSASDVGRKPDLLGSTRDISKGGFLAVFPRPPQVGDVFRVEFDRAAVDLPLSFARCLRCRFVREDAYEASFSFFKEISLTDLEAGERSGLL